LNDFLAENISFKNRKNWPILTPPQNWPILTPQNWTFICPPKMSFFAFARGSFKNTKRETSIFGFVTIMLSKPDFLRKTS
jgi:hypothetical protein